jgi:hypothetical protein
MSERVSERFRTVYGNVKSSEIMKFHNANERVNERAVCMRGKLKFKSHTVCVFVFSQ